MRTLLIAEPRGIVAKVDELMALGDVLETQLATAAPPPFSTLS